MINKKPVPLDEAIKTVLTHTPTLGAERVPISESLNRVLADNITAKRDHPPWHNAAMDGYAVRWQDIQNAPNPLQVIGEIRAGAMPEQILQRGEAIQIMTGAPIPQGADTVICVEDTHRESDTVTILQAAKQGSNIREKGEDINLGEQILSSHTPIRPAEIGIMATAGYSSTLVYQQPSVSVLATGDELVEPGEALTPEKIINSNSYSVSALVRDSGARCVTLESARDERTDLEDKVRQALQTDVALIIGGVSMGKYDYVKEALTTLGCQFKFWRVAVRPGHPVAFGVITNPHSSQNQLIFGLPGNPVSCVVAFYQFVRPALRQMMGYSDLFLPQVDAMLRADFNKKAGRVHLARATTNFCEGHYQVRLADHQGSGVLTTFSQANSLAILPAEQTHFAAGENIKVQLLPSH